jgi:DNA-binding SARP family transcriptional activator
LAAKASLGKEPKTTPAQEKLWYFTTLRQMNAPSDALRDAYKRLAATSLDASGWDPQTVILDWLEAEIRTLHKKGQGQSAEASQLMAAAVTLANALRQ